MAAHDEILRTSSFCRTDDLRQVRREHVGQQVVVRVEVLVEPVDPGLRPAQPRLGRAGRRPPPRPRRRARAARSSTGLERAPGLGDLPLEVVDAPRPGRGGGSVENTVRSTFGDRVAEARPRRPRPPRRASGSRPRAPGGRPRRAPGSRRSASRRRRPITSGVAELAHEHDVRADDRDQRAGVHVPGLLDVGQRRDGQHELAVGGAVEPRAQRVVGRRARARPGPRCSSSASAASPMPCRRAASARSARDVDDHPQRLPSSRSPAGAPAGRRPRDDAVAVRRSGSMSCRRDGVVGHLRHCGPPSRAPAGTRLGFRRAHLAAAACPCAPRAR